MSMKFQIQPIARWSNLKISREILVGTIPLQNPMAAAPPSFNEAIGIGVEGQSGDPIVPSAPSDSTYGLTLPPYPEGI